jgi:cell division protein FtsI/penicillin-binding protein 2
MRQVAVVGTASALADVPGEPVHAKTGTAEYGTETPPRTHAWTVGFQGNVAFAVLVEEVAVPVAETFLRALNP